MKTPRPVNNLYLFVDGQNFISHVRNLFPGEFRREDYLPRTANWGALFNSVAKTLHAKTLDVYWYTINHLDYHPHIDWENENLDQLSRDQYLDWREHIIRPYVFDADWPQRLKMKLTDAELEFFVASGEAEQFEIINRWRRKCSDHFVEMERRIREWHRILDEMAATCPNVHIRKTGWQLCYLVDKRLGTEKAVDTGLVADLVHRGPEFDSAVIFSTDGDYVPAVRCAQKIGKQVGHVEYQSRHGLPVSGISRHLSGITDFTLEIPFELLKKFLNLSDERVDRRENLGGISENEARHRDLVRRFQEISWREIEKKKRSTKRKQHRGRN